MRVEEPEQAGRAAGVGWWRRQVSKGTSTQSVTATRPNHNSDTSPRNRARFKLKRSTIRVTSRWRTNDKQPLSSLAGLRQ